MINAICEIMTISRSAYFKFKKENRPIIFLLEKYFSDEELQEFLETRKIMRLELNRGIDDEIEDFTFKTAIYKLKSNKNWAMKLFYRVLDESNANNKMEYLIALDNTKTKMLLEHSNWKNIIRDFVEEELSNLEIKMLIKNKGQIKQIINKKSQEED